MKKSTPLPLAIRLPFTPQAAIQVLKWGSQPDVAPHCHKDIALWCDSFWCQYMDDDPPKQIARLLPILADVDLQWDLYLANTFELDALQKMSFEEVRLPVEWFDGWLRKAEAQPQLQADPPSARGIS